MSSLILAECSLHYHEKLPLLTNVRRFRRKFLWTNFSYWQYKTALNIWLGFNSSKWRIQLWFHAQHNFIFYEALDWLRRFILVNPLPFVLNIVIKVSLFVTRNDIWIRVISLPWEKTFRYGYEIICLSRNIIKPNAVICPIFFSWQQIVVWDVLRSTAKSQILL